MNNIQGFVDNLIEEKGLSGLDENVLVEMKADLSKRVEDRINAIIVHNMPEASRAEFEKMVESAADDAEVQKFCLKNIPNLEPLITVELAKFQDIYLGR